MVVNLALVKVIKIDICIGLVMMNLTYKPILGLFSFMFYISIIIVDIHFWTRFT